jgi:ABC-2 type transport system ATP-binding protein
MISITDLTAGYGGEPVLKGLTANLVSNKIHGLVGLNGSGKTTLLRVLFGQIKAESGFVRINGNVPGRKYAAFLESDNYFYHNITGFEYLSLFVQQTVDSVQPWLDIFSLPGNKFIDEYSTGMKKKLAFIVAVISGRPVLLLDEPFNGLDMESARIVSLVLEQLRNNGKTIIITSHILGSLTELCDSILFLKNGITGKTFDGNSPLEIEKEVFRELDVTIKEQIVRLPGL